jgi:NodT family efflux transporter outer membrane factor (OMF) lipoprotein
MAGGADPAATDPAPWWQALHDPALDRLIAQALTQQPGIRAVAHRIHQAEALARQRQAVLTPSVDLSGSLARQHFATNSVQSRWAGQTFTNVLFNPIQLRYHLDLWGGDRAAVAAAAGLVRAEREEAAAARLVLGTALARAYGRLLVARERARLLREEIAVLEKRAAVATARYRTGVDTFFPSTGAQAHLAQARDRLAQAEAEEALLRHQLAQLAGQGPTWGRGLAAAATLPPALTPPTQLPIQTLAARPDLRAALARIEAAGQEIAVARAAFYPNVDLVGFAGLQRVGLSDLLFNASARAFAIGPSVTLPIFEGGRLRAQLSEKEALHDGLVERYNAAVLQAAQQAADAVTRLREGTGRLAAAAGLVRAREEDRAMTASLHQAGLKHEGEVMESDVALLDERLKQVALRADLWAAGVDLVEATGGAYRPSAAAPPAPPAPPAPAAAATAAATPAPAATPPPPGR